uniref:Coiled-coil-helix-coiled-coil-helix domain-containing protein 3 n=1 Tax=Davidia involucrata TaxID=16924 RepID=A0A5B6YU06_DAVIN
MGDSFTIQISSNLVKQLTDDGEKFKKKTRKLKTKAPRDPQTSQTKVHQKQISDDSETRKGTAAAGWPLQPPLFLPVSPPPQPAIAELDAIRSVLQESEKVVERLQKHEEDMVREVTQRAKDLHDKEFKLPYRKPMPCLAEKDACLECYKEYVEDPLKCAHLVNNFADCTRRVRQAAECSK